MSSAPNQFLCDHCGLMIEDVKDGWFEWYTDAAHTAEGFRIVHHQRACQYNDAALMAQGKSLSDIPLSDCLGPDGLATLLAMFEYHRVSNPGQLTEVIRRLHLPHYEEARFYWDDAKANGVFDEMNEVAPYLQRTLRHIIHTYSHREPNG